MAIAITLFTALFAQTSHAAKAISISGNFSFGNVSAGSFAQAPLVISNAANATLQVTGISLPAGFSSSPTTASVHSGTTATFTIKFSPTAVQSYGGTLTVISDATSGGNTLPISGAGVGQAINVSGNLNFGPVPVNASAQQSLTISNSGTANLTVSSISYPSGFSGDFSGVLAAGDSTNVTVTFSPTAVTTYSGTVTVNSDAFSRANTIAASGAGAGGLIALGGNLNFGNAPVNSNPQQTLVISNTGTATLNVSSISYPAGFSGSFSGALAAGTSTNVTVTFSPTAPSSYGGTVTVNSDAFGGANTIAASGTGTAGAISLSGDLSFGNVIEGNSAELTLTITNVGTANLNVSSITYPAGFSGSFSGAIAPGATTNVMVTFSPTDTAPYGGTVTVNSDAFSGANTVNASGTGIAHTAIISLSGDLNFGDVQVNSSSTLQLTITNSGNTTLTFTNITFPDGFSGNILTASIEPGGTTNVLVTFSPTIATDYSGPIAVESDATDGTNTVNASGTGTPLPAPVIALSGDLSFGNVIEGNSAELTLTISNVGTANLNVSSITYPAGFSGSFSGAIAPGAATNVMVTFSPTDAAPYGGTVTVNSDASNGANTVNASGTGIAYTAIISLSGDLNFGDVQVNSSSTLQLTITNSGNSDLTISDVILPAGYTNDFSSGTLAPGTTTNINVTFLPTTATTYSGTLTVVSDATSGTNTVNVTGNGTPLPAPVIALSGDLSFGNVIEGDSAELTLTISNVGTANLNVSSIDYPAGFSGSFSGAIAPGETANVTVTFSPTDTNPYSGTVTVNSDASSGANTVNATGQGIAATKVVSLSGDLNFGDVTVDTFAQLTLTITNSGNTTFTFTNITFPDGFSGNILAASIDPGGTTNVLVTFSPTVAADYGGPITVESDATDGTNTVNATGTGTLVVVPSMIVSLSGDLSFGDVPVGASPQLTLTISNAGNSTLTVSNITYPTGFSGNFSGDIASGAAQNVTVTFAPTTNQPYSGTVTVVSDATAGTNTVTVSGDAFHYVAAKAQFTGLFYPADSLTFSNSGYFKGRANVKNAFSAKIVLAGKQYSISGKLSASGAYSGGIKRKNLSTLNVALQAGFEGGNVLKGTITDTSTFSAAIIADKAVFNRKTNAAPQAGRYVVTIAGSSDASVAPTTNSTGTIVVTTSGVATVRVQLGDRTKLAQTTIVSGNGEVPLFGNLYSHKGSVLGWLSIRNSQVSGTVDWFKPGKIDQKYLDGFSFQTSLTGSKN